MFIKLFESYNVFNLFYSINYNFESLKFHNSKFKDSKNRLKRV